MCLVAFNNFNKAKGAQDVLVLEVGKEIPAKLIPENYDFISVPFFSPSIKVEVEKVSYIIGFNEETRKINCVITYDRNFQTKEDIKIGHTISVSRKDIGSTRGGLTRGTKLKDGWSPIIGYKSHVCILENGKEKNVLVENLREHVTYQAFILGFIK
jgi:hypothetical protein